MRNIGTSTLIAIGFAVALGGCHDETDDAPPPPPAATSIPRAPVGAVGEDHPPPSPTATIPPPHPVTPTPPHIPPDVHDPFKPVPVPHGAGGGGTAL